MYIKKFAIGFPGGRDEIPLNYHRNWKASFAVDFIFILWTFDSLTAKSKKKIAVFLFAFDHTTQQKRGHFEFKKKPKVTFLVF